MSVYAVYWPELNVFKIGTSHKKRWRAFINRGAHLLGLVEAESGVFDYAFEDACHYVLRSACRSAFLTAAEAVPYLGGNGGGYVECYRVPGDLMPTEILPFIDSQLEALHAQA